MWLEKRLEGSRRQGASLRLSCPNTVEARGRSVGPAGTLPGIWFLMLLGTIDNSPTFLFHFSVLKAWPFLPALGLSLPISWESGTILPPVFKSSSNLSRSSHSPEHRGLLVLSWSLGSRYAYPYTLQGAKSNSTASVCVRHSNEFSKWTVLIGCHLGQASWRNGFPVP